MKLRNSVRNNSTILLIGLILTVLILFPLVSVFGEAIIVNGRLDLSYMIETIANSENITTIINSLILGLVVVIMSTIIAAPLAFLLVRTPIAKHKWLDIILMIPFMTPPYISSMGWILFMQKKGLFQQMFPATGDLSESFFSFFGLALVMSLHVFPFMLTILKNALLNISTSLDESGAVFGGNFFYRLRKILFPLLTGNYAIGALLVFVKTLSEYGTPATLGRRIGFYVFTTDIHRYATTSPIDFGKSASLSSVLIGICLLLWFLQNYITTRKSYNLVSGKGIRVSIKPMSKGFHILGWSYIALVCIVAIGIPYFSVVVTSLIKLRGYGMARGNFTFDHYISLFTANSKGISAISTSLFLAVTAATISAFLGTLIVVAIRNSKNRFGKIVEVQGLLPEMLPNIVLVIGLMLFWNKIYHIVAVYNTIWMMVITYVVLFLPFTIQYVTSAFSQINNSLLMAGRTFGGNPWYVFRRITLPLILKGVMTGWMMTFIITFRELVAASLVSPPNTLTVSTYILKEFEQGSVSVGMAMAVICVLLTTTALLVLNRFIDRQKRG